MARRTIARAAGASVLEIPNAAFGHGRTRNFAAERTSGELLAFLTQDATPLPGWLDAYERALRARRATSVRRSVRICRGRTRR